jgi:Ca2+-binding RTX toxin-like protein
MLDACVAGARAGSGAPDHGLARPERPRRWALEREDSMAINGTSGDDILNVGLGTETVDGLGGTDTLVLDFSGAAGDIVHILQFGGTFGVITDGFTNTVSYANIEVFQTTGGAGSDSLAGLTGADILSGGGGNDTLSGGGGADVILGGAGVDRWVENYETGVDSILIQLAGAATDSITSTGVRLRDIEALTVRTGFGNDSVSSALYAEDDDIRTGEGDDTISPGLGRDFVDAGGGTDLLILDFSSRAESLSRVDLGFSTFSFGDQVLGTNLITYANVERLDITGGAGNDEIVGGGLDDKLSGGAGNDRLIGGAGTDIVLGGTGTDHWEANFASLTDPVVINLNLAVSATVTAAIGAQYGSIESIAVTTGGGNDAITGLAGVFNDTFIAGAGNDTATLGRGIDRFEGGTGTDVMVMNWSAVTAGIVFSDFGFGNLRYSAGVTDRMDFREVERYTLIGGSGNDDLRGGAENDTLRGGVGNDRLNGSSGLGVIDGGAGTDVWTADLSVVNTAINFNATTNQTATITVTSGLTATGVEAVALALGVGNDVVNTAGFALDDTVAGNLGNDSVNLGRGLDSFNGGAGTDTLILDWSTVGESIVFQDLGFGNLRYVAGITDRMDFREVERFTLSGGAGNDDLRGGAEVDTLRGGAGDDSLNGFQGGGVVDGGTGTDRWSADLSVLTTAVTFNAGANQAGVVTVAAGLTATGIEALSLTSGSGADNLSTAGFALDDDVSTGGNNDTVNLGQGIDDATGGLGTDLLVVDYSSATTAVSWADLGFGSARYADAAGTMRIDYREFERVSVTGGSGNDALRGGAGNDILNAGAGADVINGVSGADSVNGGAGVDTFVADYGAAATAITHTLAASSTIVGAATALASIEQLNLSTGAGADSLSSGTLVGNDVYNTRGGNDTINPGRGRDAVNAGDGVDKLVLDYSALTTSIVNAGDGGVNGRYADTLNRTSVDYSGVEVFDLTGGSGNDRLFGGAQVDRLAGGAGTDFLTGGGGADQLFGGAGTDLFLYRGAAESAGANADTINDAAAGDRIRIAGVSLTGPVTTGNGSTLGQNAVQVSTVSNVTSLFVGVDGTAGADMTIRLNGTYAPANLQLAGTDIVFLGVTTPGTAGNDTLTGTGGNDVLGGGAGNDTLSGLAGDDVLNGGAGLDTLIGGLGRDTLTGGTEKDLFRYTAPGDSGVGTVNRDTITDFSAAQTDQIDLSAIDANPARAGDQAFAFIGAAAFTGVSGQLRFAGGLVEADLNGDGFTDFSIALTGVASVAATDFLL